MRAQEVKIKWGGGVNITLYTVNKMYRKLKFIKNILLHTVQKHDSLMLESYLTHFCDGVVKHSPSIIRSLSDQFDLPGTGWEPQVLSPQLDDLLTYLCEHWLALLSSRNITCQAIIVKKLQVVC